MKKTALLLALFCAGLAQAQTAYRWVDQDGKVHYGDRPPPPKEAREVQERKYSAPAAGREASYATRQAQENFPVTLYVSADCPVCQEGRDYLKKRGIPFGEQLVTSNEEIDALRAKLGGGEVMVPSLQVGAKMSKGFLAPAWTGLLDAAGYPK
jgi:glutaredoxin